MWCVVKYVCIYTACHWTQKSSWQRSYVCCNVVCCKVCLYIHSLSLDAEEFVAEELRKVASVHFTARLQRMLHDRIRSLEQVCLWWCYGCVYGGAMGVPMVVLWVCVWWCYGCVYSGAMGVSMHVMGVATGVCFILEGVGLPAQVCLSCCCPC